MLQKAFAPSVTYDSFSWVQSWSTGARSDDTSMIDTSAMFGELKRKQSLNFISLICVRGCKLVKNNK